jgi:hypothetical protein
MNAVSRASGKQHSSKKRSSTLPKASVKKRQACDSNKSSEFGMIPNPDECFQMMAMIVSIDTSIQQQKRGKCYS